MYRAFCHFTLLLFFSSCLSDFTEKDSLKKRFKGFEKIETANTKNWSPNISKLSSISIEDGRSLMLPLSEIVDSVFYVKLESRNECMVGHIDKIYQADGRIFLIDKKIGKEVHVFDENGKFLSKVSYFGEGPTEYSYMSDVSIDKVQKQIVVLDMYKYKFYHYDYNGMFIKTEPIHFNMGSFEFQEGETIVSSNKNWPNSHIDSIDNYNLLVSSKKGAIIGKSFRSTAQKDFHFWNIKQLERFENEVYYNPRFCDTIFKIRPEGIEASYHLDFNGKSFSDEERNNFTDESYTKRLASPNLFYFNGNYSVNNNYLYFQIMNSKSAFGCLYNIHKKRPVFFSGILTNRPDLLLFNFPYSGVGDFFVTPLYAPDIVSAKKDARKMNKSAELIRLYEKTQADDNPVLLYYKLKK